MHDTGIKIILKHLDSSCDHNVRVKTSRLMFNNMKTGVHLNYTQEFNS
jgi:hypothetical protein